MKTKCKLPKHLYSIMRVALDDLKLIEKNPNYSVYMEEWHEPPWEGKETDKCLVCLAGAVMAQTCKTSISNYVSPEDFPEVTKTKLYAINSLRLGEISDAYSILNLWNATYKAEDWIKAADIEDGYSMPTYATRATNKENNKRWWLAARKLQKALKKANI